MGLHRRQLLTALAASSLAACSREPRVAAADGRVLDIKHMAQETNLCVPTSAAMVLAFYGEHQSPRRLKALSRGKDYAEGQPFDDFTITLFKDLISGLHGLGYYWTEHSFGDDRAGFKEGMALAEAELIAGRPVMIDASLPQGHTVVIRGIDRRNRRLFIVDPAMPAPGQGMTSYDAFEPVWNEHFQQGRWRALVTTRPKNA